MNGKILALMLLTSCATQPIKTVSISAQPTPPIIEPLDLTTIQFGTVGSCLDAANLQNLMLNLNQVQEHITEQQAVISFYQQYLDGLNAK